MLVKLFIISDAGNIRGARQVLCSKSRLMLSTASEAF